MIDFLYSNLPQILGFGALIFSVAGFQNNNRKNILIIMGIGNFLWAAHFFLTGALTGAAMNGLAIFRNYVFENYRETFADYRLPLIIISVFALATILTWQGIISLLPFGGMTTGTIAFWQRNPKHIRLLSLLSPPLWFTHNFIQGSYPGMIIEILVFFSILIAIFRYDVLNKSGSVRINKNLAK